MQIETTIITATATTVKIVIVPTVLVSTKMGEKDQSNTMLISSTKTKALES